MPPNQSSKLVGLNGLPATETPTLVSPTGAALTSKPEAPQELPAIRLEPFGPAKSPLGFSEREGQFLVHNKDGIILAVCNRPDVAGMFCDAVRLFCMAAHARKQEEQAAAEVNKG